jgi:hypothetical protein
MDIVSKSDQSLAAGERKRDRPGAFMVTWLMLLFVPIGLSFWIFICKRLVTWIF